MNKEKFFQAPLGERQKGFLKETEISNYKAFVSECWQAILQTYYLTQILSAY